MANCACSSLLILIAFLQIKPSLPLQASTWVLMSVQLGLQSLFILFFLTLGPSLKANISNKGKSNSMFLTSTPRVARIYEQVLNIEAEDEDEKGFAREIGIVLRDIAVCQCALERNPAKASEFESWLKSEDCFGRLLREDKDMWSRMLLAYLKIEKVGVFHVGGSLRIKETHMLIL